MEQNKKRKQTLQNAQHGLESSLSLFDTVEF